MIPYETSLIAKHSLPEKFPDWKTGYPPPELMQDDNKELSVWFSTRLGAKEVLRKVYSGSI